MGRHRRLRFGKSTREVRVTRERPLGRRLEIEKALVSRPAIGPHEVAGRCATVLLSDAEQLSLLEQREASCLLAAHDDVETGPLPYTLEIEVEDREHVLSF